MTTPQDRYGWSADMLVFDEPEEKHQAGKHEQKDHAGDDEFLTDEQVGQLPPKERVWKIPNAMIPARMWKNKSVLKVVSSLAKHYRRVDVDKKAKPEEAKQTLEQIETLTAELKKTLPGLDLSRLAIKVGALYTGGNAEFNNTTVTITIEEKRGASFLHEIGHYIDHSLGGILGEGGKMGPDGAVVWPKPATDVGALEAVTSILTQAKASPEAEGWPHKMGGPTSDYYMRNEEIFARMFDQYMFEKSTVHRNLVATAFRARDVEGDDFEASIRHAPPRRAWVNREYFAKSISPLFDKLFEDTGMTRSKNKSLFTEDELRAAGAPWMGQGLTNRLKAAGARLQDIQGVWHDGAQYCVSLVDWAHPSTEDAIVDVYGDQNHEVDYNWTPLDDNFRYVWHPDAADVYIEKHLAGQHKQETHAGDDAVAVKDYGHMPRLSSALEMLQKEIGVTKEDIKKALTGASSPDDGKVSSYRAAIESKLLDNNALVPDAVTHLLAEQDQLLVNARVKAITKGNVERALKEYAETPLYDLECLSSIKVGDKPQPGQAQCNIQTREVMMGSTSVTGDFRHELGHAIHAAFGGRHGLMTKNSMTGLVAEHYKGVKAAMLAHPEGKGKKMPYEWYEEKIGVIGRRGMDNWKEDMAEHYRGYHRALYQDKHEKGNGKNLALYRKRHPMMAKLFDAHYTAALLGMHLGRGTL
jgi:hypothetical protein